ncbi:TBC1 domain family member 5 [Mucor ambiguus]|uniref:TBC1 domain family member 5 n=1 Tax=Mucor ambiguus TaxID=91626 RepID=A0A0C9LY39_9FUNG|nr:TBC1 domain family member 5 [Mucor ambiguus]
MTQAFEEKRKAWDIIFNDPNLSLNSLRHRAVAGSVCQNGLRSVCWKIFLGYLPTLEVSKWPSLQLEQRQHYTNLKRKYIEEPAENMNKEGEEDLSDNNPLALSDSNPWQQYFADTEIRKVIRQDVERTFPDVDFFRENDVQQRLTDILFIYCKLNREVSYRQGMHELLAPFYWILATESLDASQIDQHHVDPASKLMLQVLDSAFVEHDAYILFDKLMTFGKSWYEFNEEVPSRKPANSSAKPDLLSNNIPKPTDSARLNPIVMTCHRIHHEYLRTVDPLLYRHLESFGIEPQLYGIRWIRLLFGREFDIYELLKLWDAIFAQDPTLNIVEYVCLVILLRMRDQCKYPTIYGDYAECLTMLMRPPQITKPASLVEQAKNLQENLSEDTALHILQQNDVRSGKDPRNSMSDGVPEVSPAATAYAGQQHLQPRTLNHRSSQGFDSFSRITNNMMKNPQVRDLNRAIAGVMKNVNTFGENVLGRPQDGMGPRRSTVSSEFPSGIDRIANTHKYDQRVPPIPIPKSAEDQAARTSAVNRKMGEMMAKCISLLETEIFPEPSTSEDKYETISKSKQDLQAIPDDESKPSNQEADEADQDVTNYDSSSSSVSEDKKDASNYAVKEPLQDDATIIMALAGLKHVRDVLLGKQGHFDASAIDIKLDSSTPNSTSNGEDWKWDLVDHKEIASTASIPSSPPPPTIAAKRASATIFVPPQTSSSLISTDMDSPTFEKDTKPLPPIIQQSEEKHQKPTTVFEEPKLPQAPITYISTNPPPTKQQIKYRIEDLLSDPDLQLPSPKASANAKFKWMLENENIATDKQPSSLSNQSTSNGGGSQELFKSEQRLSPRKRSSFIIKKPVSDRTSESTVDPLDAKNVDSRRSYEYDIL